MPILCQCCKVSTRLKINHQLIRESICMYYMSPFLDYHIQTYLEVCKHLLRKTTSWRMATPTSTGAGVERTTPFTIESLRLECFWLGPHLSSADTRWTKSIIFEVIMGIWGTRYFRKKLLVRRTRRAWTQFRLWNILWGPVRNFYVLLFVLI